MGIRIMRFALTTKEKYAKYANPDGPRFDEVTESDICKVISAWSGIPVTKINQSENERLKLMESILHERLIGQHHAIVAVSKAVREHELVFKILNVQLQVLFLLVQPVLEKQN